MLDDLRILPAGGGNALAPCCSGCPRRWRRVKDAVDVILDCDELLVDEDGLNRVPGEGPGELVQGPVPGDFGSNLEIVIIRVNHAVVAGDEGQPGAMCARGGWDGG
jgi:hypothetical protein